MELNLPEILAIEAQLVQFDTDKKTVCLKVGSALVELMQRGGDAVTTIEVGFETDELWVLRDHIDIYLQTATNQRLGIELKVKIYKALLAGPEVTLEDFKNAAS